MQSIIQPLFKPVDIAPLVFFRIAFGFILFVECVGAIAIGFVHEAYIEPTFHFTYFAFDWLKPLPGNGMIWLYALMSLFSLCIMTGFWYRTACFLFFLCFSYGFLLEKAHYINHHYLVILYSFLMIFLPANRFASFDVKFNPALKQNKIPYWPVFLLVGQMAIVYLFASFAKLNPDWLAAMPLTVWLENKAHYPILGYFFEMSFMPHIYAYGGILFDLLIVPAMIWTKTRKPAFWLAVVFHLLNLGTFLIGIFPFLAIAATALFFPSENFRKIFFPNAKTTDTATSPAFKAKPLVAVFCAAWMLLQIALPLRPYIYNADPAWTEKGHRFSWRMMLRSKSGFIDYYVKLEDREIHVRPGEFLTRSQTRNVVSRPDMTWQMAMFLKGHYESKGEKVESVRAVSRVSLNGRPMQPFTDPYYDLTEYEWKKCQVPPWLEPAPK